MDDPKHLDKIRDVLKCNRKRLEDSRAGIDARLAQLDRAEKWLEDNPDKAETVEVSLWFLLAAGDPQ